jgi:hypothetical protein
MIPNHPPKSKIRTYQDKAGDGLELAMSRQASEPPTRYHSWIERLVVGVVTVVFDDCDLEEHVGNHKDSIHEEVFGQEDVFR